MSPPIDDYHLFIAEHDKLRTVADRQADELRADGEALKRWARSHMTPADYSQMIHSIATVNAILARYNLTSDDSS